MYNIGGILSGMVKITAEEEEALFQKRVIQINKDCLATFMPYIKLVVIILVTIGIGFLGLTVYFYQDARLEMRSISTTTTNNYGILVSHGKSITRLESKVFK